MGTPEVNPFLTPKPGKLKPLDDLPSPLMQHLPTSLNPPPPLPTVAVNNTSATPANSKLQQPPIRRGSLSVASGRRGSIHGSPMRAALELRGKAEENTVDTSEIKFPVLSTCDQIIGCILQSLQKGVDIADFEKSLETVKMHITRTNFQDITDNNHIYTPTMNPPQQRGRSFSSGRVTVSLTLDDISCDPLISPTGSTTLTEPRNKLSTKSTDPVTLSRRGSLPASVSSQKSASLPSPAVVQPLMPKRELLTMGQIAMGDVIGRGAMGVVYRGMVKATGQQIAVKVVAINDDGPQSQAELEAFDTELQVLQELDHERIVRYLGHERISEKAFRKTDIFMDESKSYQQTVSAAGSMPIDVTYKPGNFNSPNSPNSSNLLVIFCEYLPGGSVAGAIRQFGAFSESAIAHHTKQILEGLVYLHECRVSHRDLKGDNILLDLSGACKLADFGCAKKLDLNPAGSTVMKTLKGSIPWMAPEVILGQGYGRPADIYALGCVVLEMATGKHPWVGKFDNIMQAMYRIAMCEDGLEIPTSISDICRDFISKCTCRNPKLRPTAKELLLHDFVRTVLDS